MNHFYPRDLAGLLAKRWLELASPGTSPGGEAVAADPLPEPAILESLLSICYQASLLRDETRPVRFRVILGEPGRFAEDAGPPTGLHKLAFARARPLNEHELRRLSQAAPFDRALIAARLDAKRGMVIWGILQSGPRWLYAITGGRGPSPPLPPCLCIAAAAPGRLEAFMGSASIGRLDGGGLTSPRLNLFQAQWLRQTYAPIRAELMARHLEADRLAGGRWPKIEEAVIGSVAQQMIKRLISLIRESNHGGTLLFLPPHLTRTVAAEDKYVYLKYKFAPDEPRARFATLVLKVLRTLAERCPGAGPGGTIDVAAYASAWCEALAELDEAVLELAHLVASLAAVDGAVVISVPFEVYGFGGEILGDMPGVLRVGRALDVEGRRVAMESTESVGTRHRSVYRLCQALPECLAVVVSQDGDVRFVKRLREVVTYFEHQSMGF